MAPSAGGGDPGDSGASPDDDTVASEPTSKPPASADGDHPRPDGDGAPGRRRPPRRRLLDAKTLALCALVALIAALTAGLAVSRLTADDDPPVDGLTVAEEVPDLSFERFDGSRASFADYRGQPLVVNFWASTCTPCVREMPALQRVHAALGDDVAFLGVDVLDDEADAAAFAEDAGVTYELAHDPDGAISRAFEVEILPVTALVAPDGIIVDTEFGMVTAGELCNKVNQALLGGSLTECG